ncbi:PREDICTED: nuclear transcription factor Y subunit B-6-like [Erythranthe guttata]|uniref:nuclear transcription factor Y subunit B-6-like n=1 Tax=Erythranthe guttata TaxID=4155 RepID=UPI00064DE25C|nr:PREDICTED: nuclear transcription factor Y subunit B-6-like [Erythranthe guttata]|eukprot:XP_012836455.1 PREDICTED: nuclear transcription factor Y subunit B-6-like [Erythranthe guttata]
MRRVLPAHARITDDAKEAIQECVSEFISFITTEANRRCHRDYRNTVTPEDVLATTVSLGFDDYLEPLTLFLNKHRTQQGPDRDSTIQLPQFVRRGISATDGRWLCSSSAATSTRCIHGGVLCPLDAACCCFSRRRGINW